MKLLAFITLGLATAAFAADQKLEGEAKCAKCHLKTTTSCQAVIVVKDKDGKETVYYSAKDEKGEALHDEICDDAKPAVVEGAVSEKDGKKIVKITKFEIKK
jgi:hypothetical protein